MRDLGCTLCVWRALCLFSGSICVHTCCSLWNQLTCLSSVISHHYSTTRRLQRQTVPARLSCHSQFVAFFQLIFLPALPARSFTCLFALPVGQFACLQLVSHTCSPCLQEYLPASLSALSGCQACKSALILGIPSTRPFSQNSPLYLRPNTSQPPSHHLCLLKRIKTLFHYYLQGQCLHLGSLAPSRMTKEHICRYLKHERLADFQLFSYTMIRCFKKSILFSLSFPKEKWHLVMKW